MPSLTRSASPSRGLSRRQRRARRTAIALAAMAGISAVAAGVAAGVAASVTAAAGDPAGAVVERELVSMGTRLRLAVGAPDQGTAVSAAEAAVRALEETEARLSTWRDDSELARLNAAAPGIAVPLSPALAAELTAARRCAAATGGAFEPAIGRLVELWDLRGEGRVPAAAEIAAALPRSPDGAIRLDGTTATRLRPQVRLDEGGFGKGAGLDHALAAAAGAGADEAWIDLGGQSALLGAGPWRLTVAHPDHRELPAVELSLEAGSLSTSGNGERRLVVGGTAVGHLLDPRTGTPAADFGSVSVWAPTALEADCLSTGLFVLGPDAALDWAARHPQIGVLVLERRGGGLRARASASLAGRLRGVAPGTEISFEGAPAATVSPVGEDDWSSGPVR